MCLLCMWTAVFNQDFYYIVASSRALDDVYKKWKQ